MLVRYSDIGNQPVAAGWHGLNIFRIVRMVIQRVPQLADGMAQRLIAAVAVAPNTVEQFLARR